MDGNNNVFWFTNLGMEMLVQYARQENVIWCNWKRGRSIVVFSSYLRLFCASFLRKSLWSILSEEGIPTPEQCLGPWIPWQYLSPWQAWSLHLQPSNREGIQTLMLVTARYSRSRKQNTMICMGDGLRAFCRGLWLLQPVAYGVSCNI